MGQFGAQTNSGGHLKPLGEDVSEQLEMIEAAFEVIRHVRRKKACAYCDCIDQAPAPSRPIQRSFAAPGLLANIAVAKFADYQPLYRQSVIHARRGVELERFRIPVICLFSIDPCDDCMAGKKHLGYR